MVKSWQKVMTKHEPQTHTFSKKTFLNFKKKNPTWKKWTSPNLTKQILPNLTRRDSNSDQKILGLWQSKYFPNKYSNLRKQIFSNLTRHDSDSDRHSLISSQSSRPAKTNNQATVQKNKQLSLRAKGLVEILKWVKYILSHLDWQNIPNVYFVDIFYMQFCYQFAQTFTGFLGSV